MKKFSLTAALLFTCLFSAQSFADAIPGETDCAKGHEIGKVKALVDKTLSAMKADKAAALKAITAKDKTYMDGDMYIFAYDGTKNIAHGFNEKLVGVDLVGAKDKQGVTFIVSLKRMALEKGEGCIYYQWPNPAKNGQAEDKIGFVKKVADNVWIGSGTYQVAK
jgi:signal transduction histidine kinase